MENKIKKQWADRPVIKTFLIIDCSAKTFNIEDHDSHTDDFMALLQTSTKYVWEIPPAVKEDFEPVMQNIKHIMATDHRLPEDDSAFFALEGLINKLWDNYEGRE